MMGKSSVAILPAAPVRIRNRDAEHTYRQDSDFHYLTGFPEPEATPSTFCFAESVIRKWKPGTVDEPALMVPWKNMALMTLSP